MSLSELRNSIPYYSDTTLERLGTELTQEQLEGLELILPHNDERIQAKLTILKTSFSISHPVHLGESTKKISTVFDREVY